MTTVASFRSQRAWARVAGLMYWVVLLVDLTGMQLHPPLSTALLLTGSLGTVPLALGLFYALRPAGPALATTALALRIVEAVTGILGTLAGFASLHARLAASASGPVLLRFVSWNDRTSFGAFVFTIASDLFFWLFVRSRLIPRPLAGWGLFASVVAFAACLAHLVHPAFPAMTMAAWIPMLLAETSTGLWLLLKSVRTTAPASLAPSASRLSVPASN